MAAKRWILALLAGIALCVVGAMVKISVRRYRISIAVGDLQAPEWPRVKEAAEWLGQHRVTDSIPALSAAFATRYQSVQRAITDALVRLGRSDVCVALLVKEISSVDFSARAFAVKELVRIGFSAEVPREALWRMIESQHEFEAKAARSVVGQMCDILLPEIVHRALKVDSRQVYLTLLEGFDRTLVLAEIDRAMRGADEEMMRALLKVREFLK